MQQIVKKELKTMINLMMTFEPIPYANHIFLNIKLIKDSIDLKTNHLAQCN